MRILFAQKTFNFSRAIFGHIQGTGRNLKSILTDVEEGKEEAELM